MRRSRIIQAVVATAAVGALGVTGLLTPGANVGAVSALVPLAAGLLGNNAVPSADPDGTGSAAISINMGNGALTWSFTAAGIGTVTAVHMHQGGVGTNGSVVVNFGTSLSGSTTVGSPLAIDLGSNPANYYVDIATTEFPNGAIRGQLASSGVGPMLLTSLPTPLRVYDSRATGGKLADGETRNVVLVSGKNGAGVVLPAVPLGAYAAEVTITVTQSSAAGYLALHAAGTPVPSTSTINWSALNTSIAIGTMVLVDATGRIAITAGPGSSTHVIIDVLGYYEVEV